MGKVKYIVFNKDLVYNSKAKAIKMAKAMQAFRASDYVVIPIDGKVITIEIKKEKR